MSGLSSTLLPGLAPTPLGSYLAALGVLRACGTQLDRAVHGSFDPRGFVLRGVDEHALVEFLTARWAPSPVLSPWNNASGFYSSTKGMQAVRAHERILDTHDSRFREISRAIRVARDLVATRAYTVAPVDVEKAEFLTELRRLLPDEAVAWLDAATAVEDGDARMMPILGSGGNEGVLDYSGLYLGSVLDVLLGDADRSRRLLAASLWGAHTSDLVKAPTGQFDPGSAGGFNTGPGFESKDLPNNPWSFILLIEGALLWSGALACRQRAERGSYRFAVFPFTVRHRAAGYGSASTRDEDPQTVRAEVWVPVWSRPAPLAEVARFISEGRADVSRTKRRTALDSRDFVGAVASLGVDRGVSSFVRYAFAKRRGDAFLAVPSTHLRVAHRTDIDLLSDLDPALDQLDRFLARFPSESGPPAQLAGLRRQLADAHFDAAVQRQDPAALLRVLRAIGRLEATLARRDPGKKPQLGWPLSGLRKEWLSRSCGSSEARLAASLASIRPWLGAPAMRAHLSPTDDRGFAYAAASRSVAWEGQDVFARLANVHRRRLLMVKSPSGGREPPRSYGTTAGLADVAELLSDALDRSLFEDLLFAWTWMRGEWAVVPAPAGPRPVIPRCFALLRLVVAPLRDAHGGMWHCTPDPIILPLLQAGRVRDAVERASTRLRVAGWTPRRVIGDERPDPAFGRRLAAALLVPLSPRDLTTLRKDAVLDISRNMTGEET